MLRVVLDTNVIVSALLNKDGLEALVLDLVLCKKLRVFTSRAILAEYEAVLKRQKFGLDRQGIRIVLLRERHA